MSRSAPWKDLERRHARRMGGQRLWRPDFGETLPDGESATDVWDAKCYKRFAIISLFAVAMRKYRRFTGDRRFHLVIFGREQRGAGDLVVLRADDYAADRRVVAAARELVDSFGVVLADPRLGYVELQADPSALVALREALRGA